MKFKEVDDDGDGILSIRDFYSVYKQLRQIERVDEDQEVMKNEFETFATVVRLIDPCESDIITFSSAVTVLTKIGLELNT